MSQTTKQKSAEEIAASLSKDSSQSSEDKKGLLAYIVREGSFKTHDPLSNDALLALKNDGLLETHVSPSSLWADVDTYETDPTEFVLTEIGREVSALLGFEKAKRQ